MRVQFPTALIAAFLVALGTATIASADNSTSSNWAGYAVHRAGLRFRQVGAVWRQPRASCRRGSQTYSAAWVGLGGYSQKSNALEQIGTEVDCSASGRIVSSAWYELVPAPSRPIRLRVVPGDMVAASVTVRGHRVSVRLDDLTRHQTYTRNLHVSTIDVSSAEWIVEAPSDCISATACQTLPLADFGTTTFGFATARTTNGYIGTISNQAWEATQITLSPSARRYVSYRGFGPFVGAAQPSTLTAAGSSFGVRYQRITVETNPFLGQRRSTPQAGYVVHPGR